MAPKKKKTEMSEPIAEFSEMDRDNPPKPEVAEAAPQKKSVIGRNRPKRAKRMNFSSYARRKGVKLTHVAGMRAYCKNPRIPRTVEEWDALFEKY